MADSATARPVEDDDRSVGDLVSEAITDLTQLVRYEVDLAKVELRADVRRLGLSGALLGMAAFTSLLVLVMLCFSAVYALVAAGIPPWAAFLIVAFACVLLVGGAIGIVYILVRRVSGLRKTRESVQEDLAVLRRDEQAALTAPARTRAT
jgi:uncharacterized membrane protein YqjE